METIISKINFKKIGKWLLFLGWLLFIFSFSSQQGDQSLALSNHFLEYVKDFWDHSIFSMFDLSFVIRKFAHFSIFFLLGIISYSLLKEYPMQLWQRFLLSFFICLTYACMDELHQLFVVDRDGKLFDVFIDSCGCLLGLIPLFFVSKFRQKKLKHNIS